WCPLREVEWFKVGTQPVERCREHNEPPQHNIDEWIEELGRDLPDALREAIRERLPEVRRRVERLPRYIERFWR
ncbi:MAG TPA: hypothetical protein VJ717_14240, partial [Gemmatimonadaceae bacterium]|nr:hypothetical protein [Gemmatimonadaceae bacterium]